MSAVIRIPDEAAASSWASITGAFAQLRSPAVLMWL